MTLVNMVMTYLFTNKQRVTKKSQIQTEWEIIQLIVLIPLNPVVFSKINTARCSILWSWCLDKIGTCVCSRSSLDFIYCYLLILKWK